MKSRIYQTLVSLLFTLIFAVPYSLGQEVQQAEKLRQGLEQNLTTDKLKAFTRTYGYVRFFHPSDQASLVDWNLMAIYGSQQCLDSPDDETTKQLLQKIFGPLVVDLEVYAGEEKAKPDLIEATIDEVLAWQHKGVGMSTQSRLYRSERTNRSTIVDVPAARFGNVLQGIDPTDLRGKKIRYRFQAKIAEGNCKLQGWLRVDRESGKKGLFDNMGTRPVRNKEWKEYEISGTVDDDAKRLTLGVFLMGSGAGLIDNVVLEQKDGEDWTEVKIANNDFEQGKTRPALWQTRGTGYTFTTETKDVSNGERAMRLARGSVSSGGGFLDDFPKLGEVIDAEIGQGWRVRMPLALKADTKYLPGENKDTDGLIKAVSKIDIDEVEQKILCTANVVITWNVFQHFYPYFEQVETDWEAALVTGLLNAANSVSRQETTDTLSWLVAQLHDGHGRVFDPNVARTLRSIPVRFSWIENQLVVTASADEDLAVGDVVTHIGEKTAADYLAEKEELISGSPQWKRFRSTSGLSRGESGTELPLKVKSGDLKYPVPLTYRAQKPLAPEDTEIVELLVKGDHDGEDIYYVDLGRAGPDDVRPKIEEFAEAKGIILDLRGYPRGTQFLFQHMTDEHMQSQKWQVPNQIRPDRVDIEEIPTMSRWEMPPLTPRFKGKMVFLTNGSAISYAESCMAIVANYKLGEIVGSPTAGANGNVNPFVLPGDWRVSWTGMRVMNHDDSQHHVRGVQPTVPLQPTIEAIRQGRDEYIEKALELINGE